MSTSHVACWFIGGPWNNRLMEIHQGTVGRGIPIRAFSVKPKLPPEQWGGPASFADFTHKTLEYYPSTPLETGVPVYSCLEEAIFGLRSVHRRKR